MGLVNTIVAGSTHIAVWNLDDSGDEAMGGGDNRAPAWRGPSDRDRAHKAVRAILRGLGRGEELAYQPGGRPHLVDAPVDISISHSGQYAVVALDESGYVGVDIERIDRRFVPIASTYLTEGERAWMDTACRDSMALAWCVKEAVYKLPWSAPRGLGRDISIASYARPDTEGLVEVWVDDGPASTALTSHYRFFEGYCLAWARRAR